MPLKYLHDIHKVTKIACVSFDAQAGGNDYSSMPSIKASYVVIRAFLMACNCVAWM